MDDQQIHQHIDELVTEEHRLNAPTSARASHPARPASHPVPSLRTPCPGCEHEGRGAKCAGGAGTIRGVIVAPVTRPGLALAVAELVVARSGRVRVALDGAAPTRPGDLAGAVADLLRERGRDAVVVDAGHFLRPASVRLEFGRDDPDELLERWLDDGALHREVLHPAGPVLARLWDPAADRAYRDPPVDLAPDGVVLLHGGLLLGRGLPLDAAVHLRMGPAALARHLPGWQLPAFARYAAERDPEGTADLVVLADHPDRPALRR